MLDSDLCVSRYTVHVHYTGRDCSYGDELTRLSLAEDAVKQALAACGSSGGASLSASGLSSAASGTGIGSGFGAAFSRKMTGSGAGIETGTTADATTSTGARGLPEGVVRDLKVRSCRSAMRGPRDFVSDSTPCLCSRIVFVVPLYAFLGSGSVEDFGRQQSSSSQVSMRMLAHT